MLDNSLPDKSSSYNNNNNKQNSLNNSIKTDQTKDNNLKYNNENTRKYKHVDDEIIEDMRAQMNMSDSLEGKNIEEMTEEDWDKIITPEHKESIRKINELLGD